MGLQMTVLASIIAMMGSGSGLPTPTLDQDLTTALPSNITFNRAGTRTYINAGVLTSLATQTPAFESWNGMGRGLAVEPGHTNLFQHSNDFSQSIWTKDNVTGPTAGDAGAGLITSLSEFTSNTTNSDHRVAQFLTTRNAGERMTFQAFAKVPTGATNWSMTLKMSKTNGNIGTYVYFRMDGKDGATAYYDTTMVTDVVHRMDKLASGVWRISMTGTWVTTSAKEFWISVGRNDGQGLNSFLGTTNHKIQVWGAQVTVGNNAVGHVTTTAATASQAAETAVYNDTSWLTTSQGTFVIEHDCYSGTLLGSGTNVVLSATKPGLTAIAWDGSTSDTVSNGGAAAVGVNPTFSGSDLRLLATSAAGNAGHIKSIKFYAERLTVPQLQTLTTKITVATTPHPWQGISVDNYMPRESVTTSGLLLDHVVRVRLKVGNVTSDALSLVFPNLDFAGPGANSFDVVGCYLERVTGVAESVQALKGGLGSWTVPVETYNQCFQVDDIPLSAFTNFTAADVPNTEFWARLRLRVASAGQKFPVGQYGLNCQFGGLINPALTTVSPLSGTGPITVLSGPSPSFMTYVYAPLLIGKTPVGQDPVSIFAAGDSMLGGTTPIAQTFGGSHVKQAAVANGIPIILYGLGGSSQVNLQATTVWRPYMKFARVLYDGMGTNQGNMWIHFLDYWHEARTVWNIDKIYKSELFPSVGGTTDNLLTEAGQSGARAYPHVNFPDGVFTDFVKYGYADGYIRYPSARGVNQALWAVDGVTPWLMSTDRTHLSDYAQGPTGPVTLDAIPQFAAMALG